MLWRPDAILTPCRTSYPCRLSKMEESLTQQQQDRGPKCEPSDKSNRTARTQASNPHPPLVPAPDPVETPNPSRTGGTAGSTEPATAGPAAEIRRPRAPAAETVRPDPPSFCTPSGPSSLPQRRRAGDRGPQRRRPFVLIPRAAAKDLSLPLLG